MGVVEFVGLLVLPSGKPAIGKKRQRNNDDNAFGHTAEVSIDKNRDDSNDHCESQGPKRDFHKMHGMPRNENKISDG